MVSGTEMKALKTVAKTDGKTSTRAVSRQLGIDPAYARVLCMNLTKGQYLDQESHGCFMITWKGRKALGWGREDMQTGLPKPTDKIKLEEFHWRSLSPMSARESRFGSEFRKPGQEEPPWTTMCVSDGSNRSRRQRA
jgi:hypothetical protein